jgi:phosphate transport system protein
MNHLQTELKTLKSSLLEMWSIVISQHEKAKMAIETNDKDLANEIHTNEKLLDSFELKHDMDCENLIALNNPVAIDLRFVLAVLKINYNLERIGDYANYIANTIRYLKLHISCLLKLMNPLKKKMLKPFIIFLNWMPRLTAGIKHP